MRESGERGTGFGETESAREVLQGTLKDFQDKGVVEAYVAALDQEAASTREDVLSRLARTEYPVMARRSDYVAGEHPDNGGYFLAMVNPESGEEVFALPTEGSDLPMYADSPDSLVWVCTVALNGEVRMSQSFNEEQVKAVIEGAQAAERVGLDPHGRLYLDLSR